MSHRAGRWLRRVLLACAVALPVLFGAMGSAQAHGFSTTVYVDATSPTAGHLRVELGLEYDLLVVSVADSEKDDPLFRSGTDAFDSHDPAAQAAALDAHRANVLKYTASRFTVAAAGKPCNPSQIGDFSIAEREGVPYTFLVLDFPCADSTDGYTVTSKLYPDSEGYVRDAKTIVTYKVEGRSGSAALDSAHPSFSTTQSFAERFWEFFRLGAEHLLTGLDHILFLLALIAGSRRLREIVLAATSFTVAHSITFVLAALGVVDVSPRLVEPTIALSIAVVAGWYLWRIWRRGSHATDLDAHGGHFSLDRAGWLRLGVVFCFGLVHGLGFASALGIEHSWSWTLLWSLLVFNVGIEVVQLGIILVAFPLLALLRHRAPRVGLWVTGGIAAVVAVRGLVWFVQRLAAG